MIILWHNILVHQQGALNSLLTTIANRNYRANRSGLILQKKIRKFDENKHTHTHTENSITEATLIPCGSSGERANYGPPAWAEGIIKIIQYYETEVRWIRMAAKGDRIRLIAIC